MNKKLSEISGYENGSILVKFLKNKYLDDLLNGKLYMNNFKCFIDLEKETKIKGQGDKLEAGHVFRGVNIKLIDPETNEVIGTADSTELVERYSGVEKVPLYCVTRFSFDELKVIHQDEDVITAILEIPIEDQLNYEQTFGETAVILPGDFLERIEKKATQDELGIAYGPVKYLDYNVHDIGRKKLFEENSLEVLFWKDNFFENQREFRIVLPRTAVNDKFILEIGNLGDRAQILTTKELFSVEFDFPVIK